ncbi:TonB-dependent Receptor Plug Domain [Nannocystis exedens]|uniref:TonB-dependent Receptor Plug Domain n=1 Tax=Nannocystis exedens TaxID=54 RepID=A0A1I2A8H1_9BACT|nr:TonB-dependent receptor [Nannocystis exedens]PCC69658.1 TonB family protein [Nannocystis exedens]SFE39283.1 TonB-dependent Receptor Plug Domain [Nannocystis exedens]
MIAAILLVVLAAAPAAPKAAPAAGERAARATVQGSLRSAGERTPVAGAKVFATARRGPAWTREAVSGEDGRFILTDLPAQDFILTVVAAEHQRLEQPTTAPFWRRRKPPVIYLQPVGTGSYRTIVQQERTVRPSPYSARLAPDEIQGLPGSQGDPLRALQNLPGVARAPGGLGLLVLRGATPNQSQVFFGEHPLPRAFHVPGLASVVQTGVLQDLQYIPGSFSSHYGNAVAGVVTMTPRVGRRDGLHGHAKLDITSVGGLVEGPLGKGSFLMAAQRGYLDLVLRALPSDVRGDEFIRPRYHDYQLIFDHPVGRGGSLTARILGATDDIRYPDSNYSPGSNFALRAGFHRFDLSYRKRHGTWDFLLAPAMRLDRTVFETSELYRRRSDVVGLLRAELTARPSRRFLLTLGLDTQVDRYTTRTHVEPSQWAPPDSENYDTSDRGVVSTTGVYVSSQIGGGRFTLFPGLRVNLFTGKENAAFAVDPRVLARVVAHDRVTLQFGAGLYSQASQRKYEETSGFISNSENPYGGTTSIAGYSPLVLPGALRYLDARLEFDPHGRVGAARASQLSANLHVDITSTLGFDGTVFYRHVRDNLPRPAGSGMVPDIVTETYGVEAMLRHDLTARLFGWVAYTFMNSKLGFATWKTPRPDLPADFDQRHNLVLLLGYKLPRRWTIAGRFRVVTGLPYTPRIGAQIEEGIGIRPLDGPFNSARLPVFHQLDIRVDRTWVYKRAMVAAYLDVQNLYNRQNPEGVLYNYDFSDQRAVIGVPILPVLGVRVTY